MKFTENEKHILTQYVDKCDMHAPCHNIIYALKKVNEIERERESERET